MNNNINHESGLPVNGQQVTISQTACRFAWETKNPEIRFLVRELKAENGLPVLENRFAGCEPESHNAKTACRFWRTGRLVVR